MESHAQAKRHDSKLRALVRCEALDLQRVTLDLHSRTRRRPSIDFRPVDEGSGMLGQRSGIRRHMGLDSSRLYVVPVTADVNMNDFRQEPGAYGMAYDHALADAVGQELPA